MSETIEEFFKKYPELDPFTVPNDQRIFTEPGRHSVVIGGGLGVNELLEVQVYENGGYTILEQSEERSIPADRLTDIDE
jgi:hypothetical protein